MAGRSDRDRPALAPLTESDLLRNAHNHILHRTSHERAATIWAYGTFWITLLTAVTAAAGGLFAPTSGTAGAVLGFTAAALAGLAAALQHGKDNGLEQRHTKAAAAYRISYERLRIDLGAAVPDEGEIRAACSRAASRFDVVQRDSPRIKKWPLAKIAANREVANLRADLRATFEYRRSRGEPVPPAPAT